MNTGEAKQRGAWMMTLGQSMLWIPYKYDFKDDILVTANNKSIVETKFAR